MAATDKQTFFVTGYIGEGTARENLESYCIATDKAAAIALIAHTIPFYNPIGVSSLEELKRLVGVLERVRTGELLAPTQAGLR